MLCHLSEPGGTLLTAYFGLSHSAEVCHAFAPNWNRRVGDRQRLPGPRRTGRSDGVYPAARRPERLRVADRGFNEGDRFYTDYLHAWLPEGYHLLVNSAKHSQALQVGGRNVHAMSGRVI